MRIIYRKMEKLCKKLLTTCAYYVIIMVSWENIGCFAPFLMPFWGFFL